MFPTRNPGFLIVPARINLRALPTRRTVSASPPRTPRLLSVTESVALPTHAHRAPALFALHVAHDVGAHWPGLELFAEDGKAYQQQVLRAGVHLSAPPEAPQTDERRTG